jgi:outer membrane immunogenic protein
MTMKTYLILAAAFAGWSAQASAQDFNGPSVGIQGGLNETDVRLSGGDRTRDSFVGGGFLGYDHQVTPHIVIGAQAEFNMAADDSFGRSDGTTAVRIDPRYSFDLTARAGYLVTPATLVYLRGGYSNARVRTTVDTASAARTTTDNRNGWLIGGGVERMIWSRVSARMEYRYSDLSDGGAKFDRHQVLFGVAYRF